VKRLLVIADDSLVIQALNLGLQQSGEFRLAAQLPVSATRSDVMATAPDVILIDDVGHQSELAQLIRQVKAGLPESVVIMLTLTPDSPRMATLFAAGASSAVSKAAGPAALITLIRETISGRILSFGRSVPAAAGRGVDRDDPVARSLSTRELQVLRLLAAGSTNGEIAKRLWVTEQTVKFHLANIYRKLGVGNRTEAAHYAYVHGLAEADGPAAQS
jgi:DNA-binding NarL/FixJ family response regulator